MTKRRRAVLVAASTSYAFAVWWMTLRPTIYDASVGGLLHTVLHAFRSWPAIGVGITVLLGRHAARSQDSHNPRHRKLIDTSAQ